MLNTLCRIGMEMPKNSWWRWLAGGLLGLLLLTLLTRCGSIQDDIQGRAQSLLDDNGMDWATVNLQDNGRDAQLSGEAPNETTRDQAIDTVQSLYGTRVVDHDITLKQYVSSTFALKRTDGKVVLSGTLPNQAMIDQTAGEIQQLYGTDNVTNNLQTSNDASTPKWLAGVTAMLPALIATRNIDLSANDDAVNISGDVETAAIRDEALGIMNNSFGDQLQAAIEVVKTGPTAEELAAIAAEEARKAEAARQAEAAARLAAAEEAKRQEEARLAAEAAEQAAEEARRAEQAEAAKKAAAEKAQAEQARLAAAAADKAAAEKAAADAKQQQLMAMQQHQMMMAAANRRKIVIVQAMAPIKYDPETMPPLPTGQPMQMQANNRQSMSMVQNCAVALNRLVSSNPPPFADGADMQDSAQNLFAQLNMQVRLCGAVIQQGGMHIEVAAAEARAAAAINYMQDNFGMPPGFMRVNIEADVPEGDTQLHFTITQ